LTVPMTVCLTGSDPSTSQINLRAVFGPDFEAGIDAFRRHCAKSIGCRVLASGYRLPPHFPNPLRDDDVGVLQISICRAQPFRDVESYYPNMMDRVLGKDDLYANISRRHLEATGESLLLCAIWWENIGHFQIDYWFNIDPNPRFGLPIGQSPIYRVAESDLGLPQMNEEMSVWLDHGRQF
jgi:hypothetical protein